MDNTPRQTWTPASIPDLTSWIEVLPDGQIIDRRLEATGEPSNMVIASRPTDEPITLPRQSS